MSQVEFATLLAVARDSNWGSRKTYIPRCFSLEYLFKFFTTFSALGNYNVDRNEQHCCNDKTDSKRRAHK
jgi:hypothetical protein